MSKIYEALRSAESSAALEANQSGSPEISLGKQEAPNTPHRAFDMGVLVYGHPPNEPPFHEEGHAIDVSPNGGWLTLNVPVSEGDKLLLFNEATQQSQLCSVVSVHTMNKSVEVAVAFSAPHPGFWQSLSHQSQNTQTGSERRLHPRVALPYGMPVTWEGPCQSRISRVASVSERGLFINEPNPPAAGEVIQVSFEVPGGYVQGQAVVRHAQHNKGMGIEFTAITPAAQALLKGLMNKLLAA